MIAVIIPRLGSFTSIKTLEGINRILSNYGYQMVLVPKTTIEEDEISYIHKLSKQGFDGIIVMAHAITDAHILLSNAVNIPILFTGQSHPDAKFVTLDDYEIGKTLAEFVNTLKVQNILLLSVSENDRSVGVMRKQGFLENVNGNTTTLICDFSQEGAYQTMEKESSTINYDLIVGMTDNIAIGAMKYLKDQHINIPDPVKVIGIGNYEISAYMNPPLTTLDIDYQMFGENAALEMMEYLDENVEKNQSPIHYKMIKRQSS